MPRIDRLRKMIEGTFIDDMTTEEINNVFNQLHQRAVDAEAALVSAQAKAVTDFAMSVSADWPTSMADAIMHDAKEYADKLQRDGAKK